MTPIPTVSVVIPAHDRADLLQRAIQSVLQQDTTAPFELIVVDDGSTEDLSAIRDGVITNGHIFEAQDQAGPAAARNRGIALSRAPWVAFLDSDDEWEPEKLSEQLAYHRRHPDKLISQSAETWIRNGRHVKQPSHYQHPAGDVFSLCLERCCISCSSVMIYRDLLVSGSAFDPLYPVCEDYDLWIRLAESHEIGWIPKPLTRKHAGHANQLSKAIPIMDRFRLHVLLRSWLSMPQRRDLIRPVIRAKASILASGAQKRERPHALYRSCENFAAREPTHHSPSDDIKEAEALLQAVEACMNDPDWHCAGAWRSSDCRP